MPGASVFHPAAGAWQGRISLLGAGEAGQRLALALLLRGLVWKPTSGPGQEFKGVTWRFPERSLELKNSRQREVLMKECFSETPGSHYLDLHLLRTRQRAIHLQSVPSSRQRELAGTAGSTEGLREM